MYEICSCDKSRWSTDTFIGRTIRPVRVICGEFSYESDFIDFNGLILCFDNRRNVSLHKSAIFIENHLKYSLDEIVFELWSGMRNWIELGKSNSMKEKQHWERKTNSKLYLFLASAFSLRIPIEMNCCRFGRPSRFSLFLRFFSLLTVNSLHKFCACILCLCKVCFFPLDQYS